MNYQKLKVSNLIAWLQLSKFIHRKEVVIIASLLLLFITAVVLSLWYLTSKNNYIAIPPTNIYVPQELIISYEEGKAPHELSDNRRKKLEMKLESIGVISQEKQSSVEEGPVSRFYLIKFDKELRIQQVQKDLSRIKGIVTSEPNFIVTTFINPNDPSFGNLWGMQNIQMPNAWDTSTGSKSIIVAVIDSGADLSHPDLVDNLVSGYDFYYNDSDPFDDCASGHGTHVSGTIGAVGNNGIGVVGVNWNVSIMPIKAMAPTLFPDGRIRCGGSNNSITKSIDYAIDNGAKVINMSLGIGSSCTPAYLTRIQRALDKGVIVVAAAGNENQNVSGFSPANCPGVIAVGNSTQADTRWPASNWGSRVDIAAPGVGILSTVPGGYGTRGGTSMSAPHVAGAAALLLSVNPGLSPQQVRDCLVSSADIISTDKDIGPRLNVARALSTCGSGGAPLPTATPTPTPIQSGPTPTGTLTPTPVEFSIFGTVFDDANANGQRDTGETGIQGASMTLSGTVNNTTTTDALGEYIFESLSEGTFTVKVQISGIEKETDLLGLTQTASLVQVDFAVALSESTPIIITTPTPTSTPTPPSRGGGGPTPTPTPTPIIYYDCQFDPLCVGDLNTLQICPLICTQVP